ncbi:MAG: hypothetical protein IJ649_03205 [Oscillospiraceae bacterium]|nr:hypothetical protein [Oscillospiraceae bacterium]
MEKAPVSIKKLNKFSAAFLSFSRIDKKKKLYLTGDFSGNPAKITQVPANGACVSGHMLL